MKLNQLNSIVNNNNIKVIFTDYYDTLVHRTVHPNYVLRLWAKIVISELGLNTDIDTLYFIRQESVNYLKDKYNCEDVELSYKLLKNEICKRLLNADIISPQIKQIFLDVFELADIKSERSVQYVNEDTVSVLKDFKSKGGKVYLVSDFYGPRSMFEVLLKHHNIFNLFDGIYSSSTLGKSKYKGTIFPEILSNLNLKSSDVIMIGDNEISDLKRAEENGLKAYLMPHKHHLRRNKRNNLGNDYKKLRSVLKKIYQECNTKDAQPFSEYIIFYHFFTERLYNKCRQKNIKDLFFLSREGQFLKKLFDSYQDYVCLNEEHKIKTHYLRISRQASIQFSLQPIESETFDYLRHYHHTLSVNEFLKFFSFTETQMSSITVAININANNRIEDFFDSDVFKNLKSDNQFVKYYESHRLSQQEAFNEYVNSFKVNIKEDGIFLVDIGWGGTMQESIYKFYEKNVKVTGFYVGLREIYNITENTPREGLLFSILPYENYTDSIVMANTQLYEQFAAADHGSALSYSKDAENYTRQFHEPNEKWLYENFIQAHQDFSIVQHQKLLTALETICYNEQMVDKQISSLSLKVGLLQSTKKLNYLENLNKGFYQNIGDNKVGISYEIPENRGLIKEAIGFLLKPERYFRYMVKLRPYVYAKSKFINYILPMRPIYWYYKLNKHARYKVLDKLIVLKYNFMK
ncbi:HAD family hydrolase [Winogradskyella sp.]|uniref:HAD family hydrolase n=1 Tax=Winogradskyella sp. TaxID=1883156 RepID=UPI003F6A5500